MRPPALAPQLKRDPLGDNMIHGRISVAVLGGLLMADAAGCHPVDTNQSVAPGRCLDLTFGAWAPAYQMDRYRPFPTRVQLIDSLIDPGGTRPVFKVRRWPLDSGRLATWWRPTTDSIQLTFPSSWSTGIVVRLSVVAAGPEPDTLRGHASIYVDMAPFYPPTASVTAVRVPCRLTSA